MADSNVAQTAFNAGLLSPFVSGRSDTKVYERGGDIVENWLPTVEGPLTRRPGTAMIAPQADEDFSARTIPLVYSAVQRYMLEFGQSVFRVFLNQSLVLASAHVPVSVTTITPANPLELSLATTAGLATGDSIFITGTACPEIDGQFFRITVVGAANITLDGVDGATFTAQAGPQGTAQKVYSVASPYTAAQAKQLRYAQSGDVIYLACPGMPRYKLSRTADDAWSFAIVTGAAINTADDSLGSWPPFAVSNATTIGLYLTASAAPGSPVTINATAALFTPSDVGRFISIAPRTTEMGYALITAFTSNVQVTATVYSRFPDAPTSARFTQTIVGVAKATTFWAWGAYDAVNGYPTAVGLFDGRLIWTGGSVDPTLTQVSVVDSYENHRPFDASATDPTKLSVTQSNGFKFRARSGTQDGVQWIAALDQLFLGTETGEWTLETTDPLAALGPSNFKFRMRGRSGSREDVIPVVVDSVVLFVQRAGRRVKEFVFRSDVNTYESPDMTRLSRYATLGRVRQMAYQQEPNRVIWIVLENGELRSFTYERAEEVTAWAKHPVAGTGVAVESVSAMPSYTDDEDEVWITVKRTVNGRTRRTVEVLQKFWDEEEDYSQIVFCDSALAYSGAPITKLYGLLHLRGESVQIFADSAPLDPQTVDADGSITLAVAASNVVVGMPIVGRWRSMSPEFGGSALKAGTAQGYRKRASQISFRLVEAAQGLWFGPDFTTMVELPLRESIDPMDAAVPLYTGDTPYRAFPGGRSLAGKVCLYYDEPTPCTIAAYFTRVSSEDK